MSDEIDFSAFLSNEPPKTNPRVEEVVNQALNEGEALHPMVVEFFRDESLSNALTENLSAQELREYLANTSAFWNSCRPENASVVLGEQVTIPESVNAAGGVRRSESGQVLLLDGIRSLGIDPGKILMFRITSPGPPKPEYYWTSDYFETVKGLTQEIDPTVRKDAVILVSDMETINSNGGLIVDINDDSGLPVRQTGLDVFDQNRAMAIIPTETPSK